MPDIVFGSATFTVAGSDITIGEGAVKSPSDYVYVDTITATEYFTNRLNSQVWFNAESNDQETALKTATRYMDRLNFVGEKTDPEQLLQFPRGGDVNVPQDIKDACCEIAYALLDGIDMEIERGNLDMVSQGYGNVRSTYARDQKPAHILAGIPSIVAWNLLLPYLPDSRVIAVTRV